MVNSLFIVGWWFGLPTSCLFQLKNEQI
jgi:hypothetical protein